jgi:hypothetical protein
VYPYGNTAKRLPALIDIWESRMRNWVAKIAGAIILAAIIALTSAGAARADVLVNYDGGTIHLGQSLQLGVWYQSFSGGPGKYWEGVWSVPQHKWIFQHYGTATSRGWQFWYVKPAKRGEYHTVYVTDGHRVTLYTNVT